MEKFRNILIQNRIPTVLLSCSLTVLLSMLLLSPKTSVSQATGDTIDVTKYEIHLTSIDFTSQHITAFTEVTLTTPYNSISSLPLELKQLTVDSAFIEGTYVTGFYQDDTLIRLPLNVPIGTGDTITVRVHYSGVPYHESWGGFHFSGDYAFNLGVGLNDIPHNLGKSWFPCVDNFTDRAIYDVYGTVEEDLEVIAGGMLVETIKNGNGTKTYHWHCDYTMPAYLASIAIGDYVLVSDTFQGMERDIPIDIYGRPGDSAAITVTYVNLKDILDFYEDRLGPYPWERIGYTYTADGAMEHATNIFMWYTALGTSYEWLVAHELAHMWVGDMVTCSSAEEMWLNEGWATFFQYYYALVLYDDLEQFKTDMRNTHYLVLKSCHRPSGDGSYFPLNQIPQNHTYGIAAYDKGATITQALRFYLGDSLFFEAVKDYLQEFAWNSASSYDMQDCMSNFTGIDMSGFFENWVLNSGRPHYSVDSMVASSSGDDYSVMVHARQKRKGPAFTGDGNIMEVTFMDENWNQYTDTIHFDGATGTSEKNVPFIPSVAFVDPEEKMFDATTDNYKIIYGTGSYTFTKTFFNMQVEEISDSAFVQVTHNWVPPDSLKTPVDGLRLSDYRHWRIDAILPSNFQATGKFLYSRTGDLDSTLILSEEDSIVILYRKDCSEDWQSIDFEHIGNWNIGQLIVPELMPGEYTLAVWNIPVGLPANDKEKENGSIHIYPNPSGKTFSIRHDFSEKGKICIYSSTGSEVKIIELRNDTKEISWSPGNLSSGVYTICLYDVHDRLIDWQMAIYTP